MDASRPADGRIAGARGGGDRRGGAAGRGCRRHLRSRARAGRRGRRRDRSNRPGAPPGPRPGGGAPAHRALVLLSGAHQGPVGPYRIFKYSSDLAAAAKEEPGMSDESATDLKTKVQELIDNMINPAVAGPGGVVGLIDVKDNKVYLQMGGGCQGCGAADVTLKSGIERLIKEELPEVEEVLDTTDHASGTNPFYAPSK